MYTLYKVDNSKRSRVRGYWRNNGKVYRDNITLVKYRQKRQLEKGIRALFDKGEKAIFYRAGVKNKGYCIDNKGKLITYPNRLRIRQSGLSGQAVKRLLARYGGLTVYKSNGGYFLEVFYNKKGGVSNAIQQ